MKTEDAGDYGGSCDTCERGQAKPGHRQCGYCEREGGPLEPDDFHARLSQQLAECAAGLARATALNDRTLHRLRTHKETPDAK
jgi:hypothetical protein